MDEQPEGLIGRVDRAIYDVERSIVIGALVMMSVTYVFTVIWSNMHQPFSAYDQMLIRIAGLGEVEAARQADPAQVAFIVGVLAPILLSLKTFFAMFSALWIRQRSAPEGAAEGPFRPGRTAVWALGLTAVAYGLLKVIEVVPSRWLCLLALLVLGGAGAAGTLRPDAEGRRRWAAFAGLMVGGGFLAVFFVLRAGHAYGWNLGMTAILLMYVGLIGASMATRDGKHIRVDAIRKSLKTKTYHLYNFASLVITIIFTVFLGVMSVRYGVALVHQDVVHTLSGLPQFVVAFPIGFGFTMMSLRFCGEAARSLRAWRRGDGPPAPVVEVH